MNALARLTRWVLCLALLVAATSVGQTAGAAPSRSTSPNDRAGLLGIGAVTTSAAGVDVVAPKDRGGRLVVGAATPDQVGPGLVADRRSPDTLDAAVAASHVSGVGVSASVAIPGSEATGIASGTGFDWLDAGIGAGFAAAALVLLAGLAVALSSRAPHRHA